MPSTLSIRLIDYTLEFSDDNLHWLPLRQGFEATTLRAILRERNQGRTRFSSLGSPTRDLAHHFQFHNASPAKGCVHCETKTPTLRTESKLDEIQSTIDDMLV